MKLIFDQNPLILASPVLFFALVAQWTEQGASIAKAGGSSPSGGTI